MNKIFGREKIIKHIWKLLKEHSILFTAERRIGKTTVLKELVDNPQEGFIVIFSDLEKIDTPLEFVNDILNKAAPFMKVTDNASKRFTDFWGALGGAEIGGIIKIPEKREQDWKEILISSIAAICKNTDETIVFLWDEIPYMLQKINEHEARSGSVENNSLRILDTLRALRQEQENLRMIFTGSIGLHHVIDSITDDTYSSEPTNEMEELGLEPLNNKSAREMAIYTLEKDADMKEPSEELLEAIITECDNVPFYIEKLLRRLSVHDATISSESINEEIFLILTDAKDSWELEHFRKRLKDYYEGDVKDNNGKLIKKHIVAKAILNHIAIEEAPQSINDCHRVIKSTFSLDNKDVVIELLKSLVKDHYLLRSRDGYQFSFSLIKRWWLLAEGLEGGEQ